MHSDQISQAVTRLIKLPINLVAKASTIKNTGQVLEQMPSVTSNFDAHMENGLQSVPHLKTITQSPEKMECCQLSSLSKAELYSEEPTDS